MLFRVFRFSSYKLFKQFQWDFSIRFDTDEWRVRNFKDLHHTCKGELNVSYSIDFEIFFLNSWVLLCVPIYIPYYFQKLIKILFKSSWKYLTLSNTFLQTSNSRFWFLFLVPKILYIQLSIFFYVVQ